MPTAIIWIKQLFWFIREKLAGTVAWDNWFGFSFLDIRVFLLLVPALLLDWRQHRRNPAVRGRGHSLIVGIGLGSLETVTHGLGLWLLWPTV